MVETPSTMSGVGAVAQTPGQRTTPASRDLAALALTCSGDMESRLPPGRTLNTARAAALLQMAISPTGTAWPASVPAQRGIVADGQLTREEFGIIYYDHCSNTKIHRNKIHDWFSMVGPIAGSYGITASYQDTKCRGFSPRPERQK